MTTSTQAITTSFTPPPAASIALTADSANAKTKVAAFLAAPASGAPVPSTVNILRRKGTDAFAALVANLTEPLPVTMATLSGFTAYRQIPDIPDVGTVHGWNLVKDGGFQAGGTGTTLHANATIVADSTSVTGYAVRLVATGAIQRTTQSLSVEAGKVYSFATQVKSDGVTNIYTTYEWFDASGVSIAGSDVTIGGAISTAAWTEESSATITAPGNARTCRISLYSNGAGTFYFTAIRVKQQTTAPLAWTAADQQTLGNQGIDIYEATTNLTPADADMETAGVASWTATTATLTKDATKKFSGTQSLKVTNTAANGYAAQVAALAAAQAITLSARVIGGDAGAGLALYSTPSNVLIASSLGASTDWVVRTVSGVIAGGDTGWQLRLIGGSGAAAVSNFDNCGVENKAYNTLNSGDGQEFTTTTRPASSVTETLPTGFDWTAGFAIVGTYRPDHAYNRGGFRFIAQLVLDASNYVQLYVDTSGQFDLRKLRAGLQSDALDAIATVPAAGDTVAWGILFIPGTGMYLVLSKNGAAQATYSVTSAEAQLATFAAGTPTLYIGRDNNNAGRECDGTGGIDRIWSTVDATTLAKVQAQVTGNAPYGNPTDTDTAVWAFNGQVYSVPMVDDHLVKLGTAYDYRGDVNSAGANAATATGLVSTGTVVALGDSFWLKVPATPTLNLKLPVKYEVGLGYTVPRRSAVLEPLSGAAKIVIQGPNAYGAEITLKLIYAGASGQDVTEAALQALLNLAADVWLQDIYGGLRKVKFPAIAYQHLATYMWVDFKLIESS